MNNLFIYVAAYLCVMLLTVIIIQLYDIYREIKYSNECNKINAKLISEQLTIWGECQSKQMCELSKILVNIGRML